MPPDPARHIPDPQQSEALPKQPRVLVELADRLLQVKPESIARLDRSRAALDQALSKHPEPFAVHWRIARLCALMGRHIQNKKQRVEVLKEGIAHAQQAEQLAPERVEPPYFHALNVARQAEVERSLKLIKKAAVLAERARSLDPAFDQAGPLTLLGKIYLMAPAWPVSVGDLEKAISLLEQAVRLAPRPITHLFLGQAYATDEQFEKARVQLKKALKGPLEQRWRREAKKALESTEL
ncbi:MAG: hypothetical protein JRH20_00810 [Deltaproteobacteria bacterium]|nr:hypothetical protein [Deltaproteobacteria bacterium]